MPPAAASLVSSNESSLSKWYGYKCYASEKTWSTWCQDP